MHPGTSAGGRRCASKEDTHKEDACPPGRVWDKFGADEARTATGGVKSRRGASEFARPMITWRQRGIVSIINFITLINGCARLRT